MSTLKQNEKARAKLFAEFLENHLLTWEAWLSMPYDQQYDLHCGFVATLPWELFQPKRKGEITNNQNDDLPELYPVQS